MKTYILDIREEHELKKLHIIPNNSTSSIINIPSRHIQFNIDFLEELSTTNKIYIICRSGSRANNIKNKFFKNNDNIIALNFGVKDADKVRDFGKIRLVYNNPTFIQGQGITQYMQIMFAFIITLQVALLYFNVNKNHIIIGNIIFIIFILSQVITQSCFLTKILNLFNL